LSEPRSALGARPDVGGVLVVQTAFLGDVVLTTPLLAHLAEHGPVDVVTTPAGAALLANHPAVRETIAYDKRGAERGVRGLLALARRLRARRYAVAYLAQASPRSGALAWAARIPERVGFAGAAGRRFYTQRVEPRDDLHHAERLLRLAWDAESLAAPGAEAIRPRLYPGEPEREAVDALLRGAGLGDGAPIVALAPGSVWGTKRWPYYAELAERLAPRLAVAVVGGKDDRELAAAVVERVTAVGGHAVDATGRLTLLASAALLARCAALVTNDSAPQHLASAMAVPTLAIFGPTVPSFGFGPLAPRAQVVGREGLACRPCDRHGPQRCPLGHWRCMREVGPDEVASRLADLLQPTHS
jgi:heptosyltransferase-2